MNDRQTGLDKFRKWFMLKWKLLADLERVLEAQIVDSKAKLRQTQQVNLLLDILEQKERLSMRRFQEMTGMLGDLRYDQGADYSMALAHSFILWG